MLITKLFSTTDSPAVCVLGLRRALKKLGTIAAITLTMALPQAMAAQPSHAGVNIDAASTGESATVKVETTNLKLGTTLRNLTVVKQVAGNGGVVTTGDGGIYQINCGTQCDNLFISGSVVTVNASPATGSLLLGWAGCDTINPCTVSMNSDRTITAIFGVAQVPPPSVIFAYKPIVRRLISFISNTPGVLLSDIPISGLRPLEELTGMGFNPATNQLYAIGTRGLVGAVDDRLLRINTATGAVTQIGAGKLPTPTGGFGGVAFNAAEDHIRLVTLADSNLRLGSNGTLAANDANLAYAVGDINSGINPSVKQLAFNNGLPGATAVTAYGIDASLGALVTLGGANGSPAPSTGQLNTIGSLGVSQSLVEGFDIARGTNFGYASLRLGNIGSTLHIINLATGAATAISAIGNGSYIDALAIAPLQINNAVGPVRGDLNGNGKADILVRNGATGEVQAMLMDGASIQSTSSLVGAGSWTVTHTADFNGDGTADLIWRHPNGTTIVWLMSGGTPSASAVLLGADPSWQVSHVADFDGDGKSDILWRNTNGAVIVWLMNGVTVTSSALVLGPDADWRVSHVGDFNADGKADLLWEHTNGAVIQSLMNGASIAAQAPLLEPNSGWRATHLADFNGDGKADVIWRHTSGAISQWLMNGSVVMANKLLLDADGYGGYWSVAHVSDFDGDGNADILWRYPNGIVHLWLMNGSSFITSLQIMGPTTAWQVSHVADFNGDGMSDLLWRNSIDGSVVMWLMRGAVPISNDGILGSGPWAVVP